MDKWISVEDRLPEDVGLYLAHNGGLTFITSYNLWNIYKRPEAGFFQVRHPYPTTSKYTQQTHRPTHWMPLPAPPENE